MDSTGAYFEVANSPDLRESEFNEMYGDRHKSVRPLTDEHKKA
jgi:hypothetical protein